MFFLRQRLFPAASVRPPVEVVMKYRFSDFEIDLNQHELRREGVSVHIEPQVFRSSLCIWCATTIGSSARMS